MASQAHLKILQQGVEAWHSWRRENPDVRPNLQRANLSGANLSEWGLSEADFTEANLSRANLSGALLDEANLLGADLSRADLNNAFLFSADLSQAVLHEANLSEAALIRAQLNWTDLSGANLSGADLSFANLTETNLEGSTLTNCTIYGVSAWDLQLSKETCQSNLLISDSEAITVDDIEVAQFIYLLLNNEKVRHVIDTVTSKVVLILGRFTPERKAVLDAIRDSLRHHNYLPVLVDFDKPASRDITETISTLAHMARFIIADITAAKSIPQELQAIVPDLPSVPVQPLLLSTDREYGMFEHFRRYPWVLETFYYDNLDEILASIEDDVIAPAEAKARELSR